MATKGSRQPTCVSQSAKKRYKGYAYMCISKLRGRSQTRTRQQVCHSKGNQLRQRTQKPGKGADIPALRNICISSYKSQRITRIWSDHVTKDINDAIIETRFLFQIEAFALILYLRKRNTMYLII